MTRIQNKLFEKKKHFGRPFLGHKYYTHSLYALCLIVEKKIFKEIVIFTILVNPFLVIILLAKTQSALQQDNFSKRMFATRIGSKTYRLMGL